MYARLAEQLRLRARLPVYQRRVARAKSVIAEAQTHGRCCVMVSGGKDSTALLHLAMQVDDTIQPFFIDDGNQTPWTYDVIARLAKYEIATVTTSIPFLQMLRMVGEYGYEGEHRLPGEWHWDTDDYRKVLIDDPARLIRDHGYPVALLGVRGEESRHRMANLRKRGRVYTRKDGAIIACPLADWEAVDVFTYITQHKLPLSPVYLQPDDTWEERCQRRTSTALLEEGETRGQWHRLRVEQPEFFNELAREFPEIRRSS